MPAEIYSAKADIFDVGVNATNKLKLNNGMIGTLISGRLGQIKMLDRRYQGSSSFIFALVQDLM